MLEPSHVRVGDSDFFYREERRPNAVFFWTNPGSYNEPFIDASLILKAAAELMETTGRERAFFPAVAAPEHFDGSADVHQVSLFDERLTKALIALGVPRSRISVIFAHVGMPSEWRGAMWRAAELAEHVAIHDEAHGDLRLRIMTVCRFMPMAMTVNGPFKWVLAVGSRVLVDAVEHFKESRKR